MNNLLATIETKQAKFSDQLARLNSKKREPAYNRLVIGSRDSIVGYVFTLNIDNKEYKAFKTYESAAMVRHAMLDALHLLRTTD